MSAGRGKQMVLLCAPGAGCAAAAATHAARIPTMPSAASFSARVDNGWFPLRPGGAFRVIAVLGRNAVLTQETTPLEPGTVDHKLYVRGIGTVLEQTEKGANERNELVWFTRG